MGSDRETGPPRPNRSLGATRAAPAVEPMPPHGARRTRSASNTYVETVGRTGTSGLELVIYKIDPGTFVKVFVVVDGTNPSDRVLITTLDDDVIAEQTRPEPDIAYGGNVRPRGPSPSPGGRTNFPTP